MCKCITAAPRRPSIYVKLTRLRLDVECKRFILSGINWAESEEVCLDDCFSGSHFQWKRTRTG